MQLNKKELKPDFTVTSMTMKSKVLFCFTFFVLPTALKMQLMVIQVTKVAYKR